MLPEYDNLRVLQAITPQNITIYDHYTQKPKRLCAISDKLSGNALRIE